MLVLKELFGLFKTADYVGKGRYDLLNAKNNTVTH